MQVFSPGDYLKAWGGTHSHWGPVTQIQHTVTGPLPSLFGRIQDMRGDIVPQETKLKWLECVIKGP